MLGYSLEDLNKMRACVSMFINTNDKDIQNGLVMTLDFLNGLWAEGYFE